jgi:hypothetical protein
MTFTWIDRFLQTMEKPEDYAEKTLAAYQLGMKAGGSIRGVSIQVGENACVAAGKLPATVYQPEDAPHLPLPECPHNRQCQCVYRPVMDYQKETG